MNNDVSPQEIAAVKLALHCRQYHLRYGSYRQAAKAQNIVMILPEAQYEMPLQMLESIASQCMMIEAISKAQASSKLST